MFFFSTVQQSFMNIIDSEISLLRMSTLDKDTIKPWTVLKPLCAPGNSDKLKQIPHWCKDAEHYRTQFDISYESAAEQQHYGIERELRKEIDLIKMACWCMLGLSGNHILYKHTCYMFVFHLKKK